MSDTLERVVGRISGTRFVLNLSTYRELAAKKGAHTAEERRELAGISRSTEYRWRKGTFAPNWRVADQVARRLGTTPRELFAEVSA